MQAVRKPYAERMQAPNFFEKKFGPSLKEWDLCTKVIFLIPLGLSADIKGKKFVFLGFSTVLIQRSTYNRNCLNHFYGLNFKLATRKYLHS
jgi:hypothetical protein